MSSGSDYRTINPLGYVPALQLEDGTVLTETVAIAQYVCDRVPAKNLAPPNGTLERAKLQSWLNFISSELQLGCFCPLFDRQILNAAKALSASVSTAALPSSSNVFSRTNTWGNDFSIADLYLFVVSNWARSVQLDLSPYPSILALRKCVGVRPAVQEAMRREGLIS
jgi:glutathione S-transferase